MRNQAVLGSIEHSRYSYVTGELRVMARFSQESIARLREAVDIVDVISRYIPLKKAGASYKGLCPFHDEKTPSFTVTKSSNHYHCFGCGAHGDPVAFVMAQEGLRFSQAIQFLAERYGVQLDVEQVEHEAGTSRSVLRDVLDNISKFFQVCLQYSPEAEGARAYLSSRGISLDFIRAFGIGYAPKSKQTRAYAHSIGFTDQLLIEAGILTEKKHELFADRITFPVIDSMGTTIGFSARKWHEETFGGKYINTPETALFKKSKVLFGLFYSKKRIMRGKVVCLVEGQLDALRAIWSGFDYTVATLGTAFGVAHIEQLKALGVKDVLLAFDQDDAGMASAEKSGALLLKHNIGVRVMTYGPAKDPDDLLLRYGATPFFDAISSAMEYVPFLIQRAKKTFDWSVPQKKDASIRAIADIIRAWPNPILVHESLKQLADLSEIPQHCLEIGSAPSKQVVTPIVLEKSTDVIVELDLVRWLITTGYESDDVVQYCQKTIVEEDFTSSIAQRLFFSALSYIQRKQPVDLLALAENVDIDSLADALDLLLARKPQKEKALSMVKELVKKIKERNWLAAREKIRAKMQEPGLSEDALLALAKEFDTIKAPILP